MCRQIPEKLIHCLSRGDAIIAHQRKGDDEDLAAVGGVCYGFRVPHHAGLKDQFSGHALLRTKAVPLVNRTILQLKADQNFASGFRVVRRGNGGVEVCCHRMRLQKRRTVKLSRTEKKRKKKTNF